MKFRFQNTSFQNSCIYLCLGLILFIPFNPVSAISAETELYISEFLADGNRTYADEDGEYPDWIEIFNGGNQSVNLDGWYVTNDHANLTQWAFPAINLPSGKYILVFASGKNRAVTDSPLHTNFRLNIEGEYLALVQPDGQTIAHEYAPYPSQDIPKDGFSYGLRTDMKAFVSTGSPVRIHVPANGNLGKDWQSALFNDSAWESAKLGVGFGSVPGKLTATLYEANIQVSNLATADLVIADKNLQIKTYSEETGTINYLDNDEDGHFTNSVPFPGHQATQNTDNFVLLVTGTIVIPDDGTYTFGINSDDGARLRIDGKDVIVDDTTHGAQDTLQSIDLTAGQHTIELVYFEQGGGAECELFAAKGQYSSYQNRQFNLIGDDSRGLGLEGFSSLIQSNIQDSMLDQNTSVYLRIPFEVENPSLDYKLVFNIKYNDGFTAYLNGQEIARRNAPAQLLWDSAAPKERTLSESLTSEIFHIQNASGLLHAGTNVLAIHGLNDRKDGDNFLIQPELTGIAIRPSEPRYLNPPTPGSLNIGGVIGFVDEAALSHTHGFYDAPFELTIRTQTEDGTIRYTTDCTEPSESNGEIYTGPIPINRTTAFRAAVIKPGYEPGRINTQTFIFIDDVLQQTMPDGYPDRWGSGVSADYAIDPDVVNDSRYRNTIQQDFKSLPVMSLVSDPDNFFDSREGIYTHTSNKGVAWERPCSTEFFFPDGQEEGFQINNGIRIQGGYSREADRRKHSFRMLFKRDYGPPTLRYKMFDNSPVEKFDQLVLRGGYNYTWHGGEGGFDSSVARADYLRDEFSRRLELATGKVASHGRFVHLYLNGMYWGVYNLCERPDDGFAAEYFGGEKEEYDVVTSGTRGISTTQLKGGTKDAWDEMMALVRAGGFEDNARYEAIQEYVDIDALIDYMLVIYFTGNRDAPTVIGGGGTPWNFYSNHRRAPGEGFRFFCWDSEWTIEEPTRNVITHHTRGYDDPSFIFLKLKSNPDFLTRVADRINKHFFNDGGLTPESATAIYSNLVSMMDRAIVCESARWGDVRGGSPKTRDSNWLPEAERILTTYLPVRTGIVLDQLRQSGFYPKVPAPAFSEHGGSVKYGFQLEMEPQEEIHEDMLTTSLIEINHLWKYDQSGTDLGTSWRTESYNDSRWPSGKALHYVEVSNLSETKNTALDLGKTTYYFRSSFELPAGLDMSEAQIELSPFVDDSLIVYINGQEAFRIGLPDGEITYDTFANRTVTNANYEGPFPISKDLVREGVNTIAVEVHQTNASSSDVVFGLTVNVLTPIPEDTQNNLPMYYTLDGSDPRLPGGKLNTQSAISYDNSVAIVDNVILKARTLLNGEWSALTEASFTVESAPASVASIQENLRVSELMYNPADGEEFEFIELHNTHPTSALVLNGVAFTNGIDMIFPNGTSIPPDGNILAVPSLSYAEQTAFRSHYGLDAAVQLVGPYTGKLSNAGERITLSLLSTNEDILSFEYNDGRGWPVAADGAGHSIVPIDSAIAGQIAGSLDYGRNWRFSYAMGGSPGAADKEPPVSIVINELYANPPSDESDWIELYNPSNNTIHLGDWYLSDDDNDLTKWPVPAVELAPGGWISFDEANDFNNPAGSGFGLSRDGESLFLSYLPGQAGIDRVVDAVSFKAQDADRAYGRFSEGSPFFVATKTSTRDTGNEPGAVTLAIDEIMFQPSPDDALDAADFEYIELVNTTEDIRPLFNNDGAFRLDGGVQFEFPANLELPANGRLIAVSFDPSDQTILNLFKERYGIADMKISIVGPYSGKLSNQGERIALEKPKSVDELTQDKTWGIVDEVIYFHLDPWTTNASGTGYSLQRIDPEKPGNDPLNWNASEPTIGGEKTAVQSWMIY